MRERESHCFRCLMGGSSRGWRAEQLKAPHVGWVKKRCSKVNGRGPERVGGCVGMHEFRQEWRGEVMDGL